MTVGILWVEEKAHPTLNACGIFTVAGAKMLGHRAPHSRSTRCRWLERSQSPSFLKPAHKPCLEAVLWPQKWTNRCSTVEERTKRHESPLTGEEPPKSPVRPSKDAAWAKHQPKGTPPHIGLRCPSPALEGLEASARMRGEGSGWLSKGTGGYPNSPFPPGSSLELRRFII